jgi:sugar phosphate isomerase/epimerase
MKIGASSLSLMNYSIEHALNRIIEMGFEGWEIVLEGQHLIKDYHNIKDLIESYNLPIFIHAPFSDLNIASLNEKIRIETVQQIIDAIKTSHFLNARLINIHPGRLSPLGMYYQEKAWQAQMKSIKEIVRSASDHDLLVCLENPPNFYGAFCSSIEEIKHVFSEEDQLYLTLDLGHAHTCGDVSEYLHELKHKIRHMHLHDNDGTEDRHLGIGEGTLNLKKIIPNLRKFSGYIILETKDENCALTSKERLEKFIEP